ncbi:MAG: hypothetical protein ACNYPG_02695 [Candidatus Porifericomitaceae bacterium WSBS_2022_MAG_OTU9]
MSIAFIKAGAASVLLAALAVATPATSWAADRNGNYAVWGAGVASCNQYNQARLSGEDKSFRGYISGYFTHYNSVTERTTNIAGSANMLEILGMLDETCSEKPVLGFHDAMAGLIVDLYQQRQR